MKGEEETLLSKLPKKGIGLKARSTRKEKTQTRRGRKKEVIQWGGNCKTTQKEIQV